MSRGFLKFFIFFYERVMLQMPRFVINQEYIPVSSYFIENCLKDVNGAFLKVYLYALNLAVKGAEIDMTSIASDLNLLESDVLQAFTYWKSTGMILEDSGVIEFCPKPISLIDAPAESGQVSENLPSRKHSAGIDLAQRISADQSLSDLVLLAQELLAKPLTNTELETLCWIYDELNYTSEAILIILDYCISKGKKNLKYIEKVAVSWHEKGLTTPEQLLDYISKEDEKNGKFHAVRKGLGISDRPLSKTEEKYILKWTGTWNMPDDMILLAYEYCLLNTSRLSFPYMDKIIEHWHRDGITTKAAAEEANRKYKGKSTGFDLYKDSFNHAELEKLTRNHK